jgi:hypothetical protein
MKIRDQLVNKIVRQQAIDLEELLLCQIGLNDDKVREYQEKLDQLQEQFKGFDKNKRDESPVVETIRKAKSLHDFLWLNQSNRYNGNFRLDDVIDAQLTEKEEVGNCLGLTSLYSVLGLREGLDLGTMTSPGHIKSILLESEIIIENTSRDGFGKTKNQEDEIKSISQLVKSLDISLKNTEEICFSRLINLTHKISVLEGNERYKAYVNRAFTLVNQGYIDLAIKDIEKTENYFGKERFRKEIVSLAYDIKEEQGYHQGRKIAKVALEKSKENLLVAARVSRDFNLKGKREYAREYIRNLWLDSNIRNPEERQSEFYMEGDRKLTEMMQIVFDKELQITYTCDKNYSKAERLARCHGLLNKENIQKLENARIKLKEEEIKKENKHLKQLEEKKEYFFAARCAKERGLSENVVKELAIKGFRSTKYTNSRDRDYSIERLASLKDKFDVPKVEYIEAVRRIAHGELRDCYEPAEWPKIGKGSGQVLIIADYWNQRKNEFRIDEEELIKAYKDGFNGRLYSKFFSDSCDDPVRKKKVTREYKETIEDYNIPPEVVEEVTEEFYAVLERQKEWLDKLTGKN